MCPKETIVDVTDVPIFAPIIIGTALRISGKNPVATSPTTMEVVKLLDCVMAVPKIPMNKAINGWVV